MNLLDVFYKKSRIVDEIVEDILKNPESWNKIAKQSMAKGDIQLLFCDYFGDLDGLTIEGQKFPCTIRDKIRLKRVKNWWMRNAPLVNLRSNTLEA